VKRVSALADPSELRWALSMAAWRRTMRSRSARAEMDVLLAALFGRGPDPWRGRLRAAAYMALPLAVLDRLP
jgi:hypothetical protein